MRLNSILMMAFITIGFSMTFLSCEKKGKCGDDNISSAGSTESHNFGQNCMQCHVSGGEGEGCFAVAGSVVSNGSTQHVSGGVMKLYSQPNGGGQLMHTVQIDANGNFHTTESISMTGLYPAITSSGGTTTYMSTAPANGACNSCHGVSTGKIYAN